MKALRRIQTRSSLPNPSSPLFSSPSSPWTHLRSAFVLVTSSSPASCSSSSDPHRLKSSWSRRKRKKPLTLRRWKRFFTPEGRLENGGVALLKKVRNRGIDPSIRSEVWPFLLGVYDFNSSKEERSATRTWRRKAYVRLRRQCRKLQRQDSGTLELNKINKTTKDGHYVSWSLAQDTGSSCSDDHEPLLTDRDNAEDTGYVSDVSCSLEIDYAGSRSLNSESSGSDSSDENDSVQFFPSSQVSDGSTASPSSVYISRTKEDFVTWQRIIRLDALRADTEWTPYSSSQATVSEDKARRAAEAVVLKDYSHLEPWKIYHAARLVAVLEAYALHDPEIGYCQGMSDLLSPILSVIPDDHEAFWCFVGFMKKARQNFRLDEVGITRQLKIVSKMIKYKDLKLYKHLEKVKAEDCFFVYRMVLVMFRRELSLEQTLYLWEVMWADEASTRGGIGISSWSRRIKQHAPPTDDLLLYVIAASVLQRRKLIIEKYNSMEEILGDCHNMVGKLDVWKLLDDAHDLIINLHTKIEHSTP